MATEPKTGLTWQEANSLTTDALHNQLLDFVSVWVNCVVLNVGQAAPTGSEAEGDCYIVGTGTGVFAGHDDELAILRGGTWQFHAPPAAGVPIVKNLDDGDDYECLAGAWAAKTGGGGGGGGGGGMVLIGSATAGSGGSASLSVGSIPGTFSALKVVYMGRGLVAATFDDLRLVFNADTGSNYDYEHATFTGGSPGYGGFVNTAYAEIGYIAAATAPGARVGVVELMIPDYANTIFDKELVIATGTVIANTTSGPSVGARSGCWHPGTPAAITALTVTMGGGNHAEGSKLLVYGLPM